MHLCSRKICAIREAPTNTISAENWKGIYSTTRWGTAFRVTGTVQCLALWLCPDYRKRYTHKFSYTYTSTGYLIVSARHPTLLEILVRGLAEGFALGFGWSGPSHTVGALSGSAHHVRKRTLRILTQIQNYWKYFVYCVFELLRLLNKRAAMWTRMDRDV
jgi:hypothetical protein